MLNHEFTVEPRLSLKWKLNDKQSVSIAYGLHSRLEPFGIYLTQLSTPSGVSQPNKKLRLTKSHHLVFSYEHTVGPFMRILIEPYYQYLFDVPVIADSSFSMLNLEIDWFFKSPLINSGRGRNAGIDFTCERFLNHGYYFLVTGSLFNAVYEADDGITRNARFNKNFVFNILYGREWNINSKTILSLSGKFTLLGGDRYSPVNQVSSGQLKDVVYDESNPFTQQEPSIYYVDFSASWKRNKRNYSSTWSFQFINLLFQKEFYGHRYNLQTGNVEDFKEMIVIPSVSYRIDF
jgi:hypothetical protein